MLAKLSPNQMSKSYSDHNDQVFVHT